ncbi:hypothetical protein [Halalkalibacter alkalisediminis]|uniref:Uncharacterized protein n=1 Tax=Halalkalibacter alkalisediminis TaxID=935616 RepID=A0ABV6NJM0_9BACI|nr:hypothetical protein [Halalkalibacter alkalisediminis]
MERPTIKDFETLLETGHDIEFFYKGEKYTIINVGVFISLSKYESNNYQEFSSTKELIFNANIDNFKIVDIWDEIEISYIY